MAGLPPHHEHPFPRRRRSTDRPRSGSGPLATGFAPAGSHLKGFRSVSYCLHRFPLSQAWPGAQSQAPVQLRPLPDRCHPLRRRDVSIAPDSPPGHQQEEHARDARPERGEVAGKPKRVPRVWGTANAIRLPGGGPIPERSMHRLGSVRSSPQSPGEVLEILFQSLPARLPCHAVDARRSTPLQAEVRTA